MSQVSFATAKALKEAGLPQPKAEPCQWWYLPKLGTFPGGEIPPHCVIYISKDNTFSPPANKVYFAASGALVFRNSDVGQSLNVDNFMVNAMFAPDAEYILPLIGNNALIKFRKDETGQVWECNIDEGDGREKLLGYHETNPAEAAAMAWLMINENGQSANDWLDIVTKETPKS